MTNLDALEKELGKTCPDLELRKNEPMSRHTSFRVGGSAALMALPKTEGEAKAAFTAAQDLGITPFFLGNGSNLLVSDRGYEGFMLKYSHSPGEIREVNRQLVAKAGTLLSQLAKAAWGRGLTGLEFASGIPGSVGGAVYMNAGAYGGEMAQVVSWVKVLNEKGEVETIPAENCDFAYRHSAFSDGKRLILQVGFTLEQGNCPAIKARMEEFSAQRRAKQPLEFPSAGSTFKRPAPLPDGTPVYAAALIDQCGLKGLTVGGAQVSEKHAGFIINKGGATCADILALIEQVKTRVYDQTGVELELEVKTLGV